MRPATLGGRHDHARRKAQTLPLGNSFALVSLCLILSERADMTRQDVTVEQHKPLLRPARSVIVTTAIKNAYPMEVVMLDIEQRGLAAAIAYLERTGQTIVVSGDDAPDGVDVLGLDGETLVGTLVRVSAEAKAGDSPSKRAMGAAMRVLRGYRDGVEDAPESLRIDAISILVIAEDRALLRHHRSIGDTQ